jgi:hypothetical protein
MYGQGLTGPAAYGWLCMMALMHLERLYMTQNVRNSLGKHNGFYPKFAL